MSGPRVYLAGPDVFRADAREWAEDKRAICARHGLLGVVPLDEVVPVPPDWGELPEWRRIALKCEAHIRSCDALLANLTPFRGPSADVGTVYEMGFARALGLRVFGYTADRRRFYRRTFDALKGAVEVGDDGVPRDIDGMSLEQYDLTDNLMLDGAIVDGGASVVTEGAEMLAFMACVAQVAASFGLPPRD